MKKSNTDKKADISADIDRSESITTMEPLLISKSFSRRGLLVDLAFELATRSAALHHSLPKGVLRALADLVRSMNCYYSNLIEGHDTHPVDIERALNEDYSSDSKKRDLQLEARAHITVQKWIDQGGLKGRTTSEEGLREVHRRFCELLPESMLETKDKDGKHTQKILPGMYRDHDVVVGKHVAISPGAVPRFINRFEKVYSGLGKSESILATAAAHHRLLWIHPFLDGNGRVAGLMSHAMLLQNMDTGGIWSVARGLARHVADYKMHLANCDMTRRNDLDGRGNLSEANLAAFTEFFLQTCIDQVSFMAELIEPENLQSRMRLWAESQTRAGAFPLKAALVIEAVLYRGELPRTEVPGLIGASDRHGRRLVAALLSSEVLVADGPRSNLRLAFPARLAHHFMPGLFPVRVL